MQNHRRFVSAQSRYQDEKRSAQIALKSRLHLTSRDRPVIKIL